MTGTRLTRIGRALRGLAAMATLAGVLALPLSGQEWKGVDQFVADGDFLGGEPGEVVVRRSGRVGEDPVVALDVASARQELAKLQAAALLDRRWTEALEALLVLRTRAVGSDDPMDARLDLLVDMARIEIDWCLDLGNESAAHSATRYLLLSAEPASLLGAARADEVAELAGRFLSQPEITALRATLADRLPTIEPGLEQTVRLAVVKGDWETLRQLGSRALPVLSMLARTESAEPGDSSHDPLYFALLLDADSGLDLMRELLEMEALLPVRALKLLDVWRDWRQNHWDEFWAVRSPRPPRVRDADLLRVIELCFAQPAPTTSAAKLHWGAAFNVLNPLARYDALTPALAEVVGRHLTGAAELQEDVLRALVIQGARRPSWFAVNEALMRHVNDAVRALAAETLADFPRSDALRARVADDEPRVRRALARSLQQRDVYDSTFKGLSSQPGVSKRPLGPEIGEPERAILRQLARDVDSEVRVEAARAIADLAQPLEPSIYAALADDPLGDVRLVMAGLVHSDPTVLGDVLERLVGDADPAVRMAVAQRRDEGAVGAVVGRTLVRLSGDPDPSVRQIAAVGLVTEAQFGASTDAALALLDDPDPAVRREVVREARVGVADIGALLRKAVRDPDTGVVARVDERLVAALHTDGWREWPEDFLACMNERVQSIEAAEYGGLPRLRATPEGLRALTRWALHYGHPAFWNAAMLASPQPDDVAAWKGLADDEFVAWWSAVAGRDHTAFRQFAFLIRENRAGFDDPDTFKLRLVLEQPELTAHARAGALLGISWALQPEDVPWLKDQLRQIGNAPAPGPSEDTLQLVGDAAKALPPSVVNPLALSLLEGRLNDYGLRDGVTGQVLVYYRAELEHGDTITRRLLRRYSAGDGLPWRRYYRSEGPFFPAVSVAVRALGLHPDAVEPGFLAEATRGVYANDALAAMARLKDPAHLEALGECLTPYWVSHEHVADSLRSSAVAALVEQMSDAAVEELLEGAARCSNASDRQQIMSGVKSIQSFQQARREWQRRLVEGDGRDGAVLQLLGMLDDDNADVRYEAVRGLATLDAADQLPRIIQVMAGDPSERVRAAAKAALDRLHESNRGTLGELLSDDASSAGGDS